MKLALYGATGMIGSRLLAEALDRGHEVTALVRDPARLTTRHERLSAVVGDVHDAGSVAALVAGHDAVISAYGKGPGGDSATIVAAARSLIDGVRRAAGPRLLVVGGAGSLHVAPGVQLVDTPDFPAAYKADALAQRDALEVYRTVTDVDWTYASPAAVIAPGTRTGTFRTGTDDLVTDAEGNSRISAEDFAVALIDEVENPSFRGRRFTAGY